MEQQLLMKYARISEIPKGWKFRTVGRSCRIRNDLRKPISVDERGKIKGSFPYYGPTGILGYINEYLADGDYALIGEDGDHFLKYEEKEQTILVHGKFNVNNHAHLIEATDNCSVDLQSTCLGSKKARNPPLRKRGGSLFLNIGKF